MCTHGAYLWNADGKRFIDYLLSYGPIVIGRSDSRVNDAVARTTATCDLQTCTGWDRSPAR